jgi:hypothetical protein
MFRFKVLILLAGMIAVLGVSATPAFAEFEANKEATGATEGKGKVLKSGEFVDGISTVTCPKEGITIVWSIQSAGNIKEHQKGTKQLKVKTGPHETLMVKWMKETETPKTKCEAKILGGGLGPAKVNPCKLQIVSEGKVGKEAKELKGGVEEECIVKTETGNCEIKVPAANEATGENWKLGNTTISNVGFNDVFKTNVTGITANDGAPLCPASTHSAELKEVELENIGQNII